MEIENLLQEIVVLVGVTGDETYAEVKMSIITNDLGVRRFVIWRTISEPNVSFTVRDTHSLDLIEQAMSVFFNYLRQMGCVLSEIEKMKIATELISAVCAEHSNSESVGLSLFHNVAVDRAEHNFLTGLYAKIKQFEHNFLTELNQ